MIDIRYNIIHADDFTIIEGWEHAVLHALIPPWFHLDVT